MSNNIPTSEAEHIIHQVVLPVWDKLYAHDFWGAGSFDAFYDYNDPTMEGPPVAVHIYSGQLDIEYKSNHHYFNLADPNCIYKAQQQLIKMFGNL